jgi:putative effector of murein hydrolase LrgA (UPF0299 family)
VSFFFWWVTQIAFSLLGIFFLLFGVFVLISAYHLDNPFWFIMTFFASNLIILISGALLLGFILRMISSRKREKED